MLHVVGARPSIVASVPVVAAFKARDATCEPRDLRFEAVLIHTDQRRDGLLSRISFDRLGMPRAGAVRLPLLRPASMLYG